MADTVKDRENKDAEESGRPVQLDPEEKGGKTGQQPGGRHDEPQQDKQSKEHGQKP